MVDIGNIVERLRDGRGEDVQLATDIHRALGLPEPPQPTSFQIQYEGERAWKPKYTASIEASIALASRVMGPNHEWIIGTGRTRPTEPLYGVRFFADGGESILSEAEHEDLPRAFLMAMLKAKAPAP